MLNKYRSKYKKMSKEGEGNRRRNFYNNKKLK